MECYPYAKLQISVIDKNKVNQKFYQFAAIDLPDLYVFYVYKLFCGNSFYLSFNARMSYFGILLTLLLRCFCVHIITNIIKGNVAKAMEYFIEVHYE